MKYPKNIEYMIYSECFSNKAKKALSILVSDLKWTEECLNYLIACMKLLSDFHHNVIIRRQCVGYLMMNLNRWKSIRVSLQQAQRMADFEQITIYRKLLKKNCQNLDDVVDTVFNLPEKSEDTMLMVNTSLQYIDTYKGKYITKGEVKDKLIGIINEYRRLD